MLEENTSLKAQAGPLGNTLNMLEEILRGEIVNYVKEKDETEVEVDPEDYQEWLRLLNSGPYVQEYEEQIYDSLFRPNGQVEIQLSSHLKRRVLLVEDEDGLIYTFRYAYTHGEVSPILHFVCASCDSCVRTNGVAQRAKVIVEDGVLNQVEDHHEQCRPVPKSEAIVTQLQRRVRLANTIIGNQSGMKLDDMDDEDEEEDEEEMQFDDSEDMKMLLTLKKEELKEVANGYRL